MDMYSSKEKQYEKNKNYFIKPQNQTEVSESISILKQKI